MPYPLWGLHGQEKNEHRQIINLRAHLPFGVPFCTGLSMQSLLDAFAGDTMISPSH